MEEGLKSLEGALATGFDNFDQIRKDKNLEKVRQAPKFQVRSGLFCSLDASPLSFVHLTVDLAAHQAIIDKYDEPVVNWGAIKATFSFFGKKE